MKVMDDVGISTVFRRLLNLLNLMPSETELSI
jgi:hypothetical protein